MPDRVTFNDDGTRMYIIKDNDVYVYKLGIPYRPDTEIEFLHVTVVT